MEVEGMAPYEIRNLLLVVMFFLLVVMVFPIFVSCKLYFILQCDKMINNDLRYSICVICAYFNR